MSSFRLAGSKAPFISWDMFSRNSLPVCKSVEYLANQCSFLGNTAVGSVGILYQSSVRVEQAAAYHLIYDCRLDKFDFFHEQYSEVHIRNCLQRFESGEIRIIMTSPEGYKKIPDRSVSLVLACFDVQWIRNHTEKKNAYTDCLNSKLAANGKINYLIKIPCNIFDYPY